jgi:hypothetical protein
MKLWMLLLTVFLEANINISDVRQQYSNAIYDRKTATALSAMLDQVQVNQPLLYAYKGANTALMAKHAFFPTEKWSLAKKGSAMLDEAVNAAPAIAEIRFLRFATEMNMPAITGLKKNLNRDKSMLIKIISGSTHKMEEAIYLQIKSYLLKEVNLEANEKLSIDRSIYRQQ